jgi:predicted aldo/keto reductase-like oxidoreductase
MKYRKMRKIDVTVSSLGFGAMRLPTLGSDSQIDEPKAIEMIRYAIDHGVNYVDTAYGYHGGQSEILVGKALKDGYRDKTYLATKLPVWFVNKREDMDRLLNEQLKKLDTDHIDFYLLHALNKESWQKVYNLGVLEWGERMKEKGLIRFFGFSFHDDLDTFKKIIDAYDWDFCQIQYNYMDVDYQAGREGLLYAYNKGINVVIMEPLRGGRLARPPKDVMDLINSYKIKRSPVEWALLWLWNHKEISTVLSGMSTLEQVKENIEIADKAEVGILSQEELEFIEKLRLAFLGRKAIDCTQCGYCMPCPYGVNIPRNFFLYNEGIRYDDWGAPRWEYNYSMREEERASNCQECGICETKCPQQLPIRELLKKVHEALAQK